MANEQRLDSWKEIASYVGRDERTVQRWELERSLPVHRLPGGRRGGVYAYRHELDAWRASGQETASDEPAKTAPKPAEALGGIHGSYSLSTGSNGLDQFKAEHGASGLSMATALPSQVEVFAPSVSVVGSKSIPRPRSPVHRQVIIINYCCCRGIARSRLRRRDSLPRPSQGTNQQD